MDCPRCTCALTVEHHFGIEVDHCLTCHGRWLDHHELDDLEAKSASDENTRRATIQYAKRPSELKCPVCDKEMIAFNYRAYDLELDTCEDAHGFWVDVGEEGRIKDIMEDRVKNLARSSSAEDAWGEFLKGVGDKSMWDRVGDFFKGGNNKPQ